MKTGTRVRVKSTITETTDYLTVGDVTDRFHYPDMSLEGKEFEVKPYEPKGDGIVAEGWYQGKYPDDWIYHESWLDFIEV